MVAIRIASSSLRAVFELSRVLLSSVNRHGADPFLGRPSCLHAASMLDMLSCALQKKDPSDGSHRSFADSSSQIGCSFGCRKSTGCLVTQSPTGDISLVNVG